MTLFRCLILYGATTAAAILLLISAAWIPGRAIRENMISSANYFENKPFYGSSFLDNDIFRYDTYADEILLSIAWYLDAEHPLKSVMQAMFFEDLNDMQHTGFYEAIVHDRPANTQYIRYWHGSVLPVRVFHLFGDIRGLFKLNAILFVLLTAALALLLWKKQRRAELVAFVISLLVVNPFAVPFTLEYTWMFLWMLCMSITVVVLGDREHFPYWNDFFLVNGMLTVYWDFLTTETITLLIPLLLLLSIREPHSSNRDNRLFAFRSCLMWGVGYVGMWVTKWVMASLVLGENVMPYVTEHIQERLLGHPKAAWYVVAFSAIRRNLKNLFPWCFGTAGTAVGMVIVFLLIYLTYLFHRDCIDWGRIGLYALLGMIPYIRYMVLANHSYLHFFFTYRAQIATIFALGLIVCEVVDWEALHTSKKGRE